MTKPMTELVDLMVESRARARGETRGERIAIARELAAHEVLSRRQIGMIVDENPIHLREAVPKEERTGGRLSVDSLGYIQSGVHKLASDEAGAFDDFYEAHLMGTSLLMLARLAGVTKDKMKWQLGRIEKGRRGE